MKNQNVNHFCKNEGALFETVEISRISIDNSWNQHYYVVIKTIMDTAYNEIGVIDFLGIRKIITAKMSFLL